MSLHGFDGSINSDSCYVCGLSYNEGEHPPVEDPRNVFFDGLGEPEAPRTQEHEFVCPSCVHRRHDKCSGACPLCVSRCLCPCRRWQIPL